ncbi:hypothetical protein [Streptomyces sp. NPDC086787]|uniref:hypothetical protein n=1 Tax=Streptomyces sp. NPDC086787 TaxID=3365759 RepID=UPI003828143A
MFRAVTLATARAALLALAALLLAAPLVTHTSADAPAAAATGHRATPHSQDWSTVRD